MELWIRSQDRKKLIRVIDIIRNINTRLEYQDVELGIYNTQERAIQILDEIQSILCFKKLEKIDMNGIINVDNNIAVFEMPKE